MESLWKRFGFCIGLDYLEKLRHRLLILFHDCERSGSMSKGRGNETVKGQKEDKIMRYHATHRCKLCCKKAHADVRQVTPLGHMIQCDIIWLQAIPRNHALEYLLERRQLKLFFVVPSHLAAPIGDFWFHHLSPSYVLSYIYQVLTFHQDVAGWLQTEEWCSPREGEVMRDSKVAHEMCPMQYQERFSESSVKLGDENHKKKEWHLWETGLTICH